MPKINLDNKPLYPSGPIEKHARCKNFSLDDTTDFAIKTAVCYSWFLLGKGQIVTPGKVCDEALEHSCENAELWYIRALSHYKQGLIWWVRSPRSKNRIEVTTRLMKQARFGFNEALRLNPEMTKGFDLTWALDEKLKSYYKKEKVDEQE